MRKRTSNETAVITGACLCGAVTIEVGVPVFWSWHDHTRASRVAHGAAYATYVGCWRKRFRIVAGEPEVTRFVDDTHGGTRAFCRRCGTPLCYERGSSPRMVNVPRALFELRTGREPRYHIGFEQRRDWMYTGAKLVPLPGYPGVVWERPGRKTARHWADMA